MFHVVANHWELIFFFLTNTKCDMVNLKKVMIQFVKCHFEVIFAS